MKIHIGKNIKQLRGDRGTTQEALAEYLGVSYQAVSRWENGLAYPDIELLPDIARFFEVSVDNLLDAEDSKNKIAHGINECLNLRKTDKSTALSKLRALEHLYPNSWEIKAAICKTLVFPPVSSYDEILPELRSYAAEAVQKCPVKNNLSYSHIISAMFMAVPENEIEEWLQALNVFSYPFRNSTLSDRYRERGDKEKALHYGSEAILDHLTFIRMMLEKQYGGEAEDVILSRSYDNALINALLGEPYKKDGKIHNSILIWERAVNQTQIAAGYAGLGEKEKALAELKKAVDLWELFADSLKDDYFISDNPYIESKKNNHFERYQGVDFGVEALTDTQGWAWFDPIREEADFKKELDRLLRKKAELAEYWETHDIKA